MGAEKEALKLAIKELYNEVRVYDGSEGKTQDAAIDRISTGLADAFENYLSSVTFVSTPDKIVQAAMVAGGQYPVIASNNLTSKLLVT